MLNAEVPKRKLYIFLLATVLISSAVFLGIRVAGDQDRSPLQISTDIVMTNSQSAGVSGGSARCSQAARFSHVVAQAAGIDGVTPNSRRLIGNIEDVLRAAPTGFDTSYRKGN